MASSSYYYNLYTQQKNKVNSYNANLKALRKVLSNLTDTMSDEIRAVNNELDDLTSELKKGVRHNSRFTSRADAFATEKEKAVTADSLLRVAVQGLQDEISRINGLVNQSIANRDQYYQQYKNKKEEERAALLDLIF